MSENKCPHCGTEIELELFADFPSETSLSFIMQIAEGQMIQAKTLSGVVAAFDDMQKAIGAEMGLVTTTLIEGLETVGNELRIRFRICNTRGLEDEAAEA